MPRLKTRPDAPSAKKLVPKKGTLGTASAKKRPASTSKTKKKRDTQDTKDQVEEETKQDEETEDAATEAADLDKKHGQAQDTKEEGEEEDKPDDAKEEVEEEKEVKTSHETRHSTRVEAKRHEKKKYKRTENLTLPQNQRGSGTITFLTDGQIKNALKQSHILKSRKLAVYFIRLYMEEMMAEIARLLDIFLGKRKQITDKDIDQVFDRYYESRHRRLVISSDPGAEPVFPFMMEDGITSKKRRNPPKKRQKRDTEEKHQEGQEEGTALHEKETSAETATAPVETAPTSRTLPNGVKPVPKEKAQLGAKLKPTGTGKPPSASPSRVNNDTASDSSSNRPTSSSSSLRPKAIFQAPKKSLPPPAIVTAPSVAAAEESSPSPSLPSLSQESESQSALPDPYPGNPQDLFDQME
jgi:hypothetical protein